MASPRLLPSHATSRITGMKTTVAGSTCASRTTSHRTRKRIPHRARARVGCAANRHHAASAEQPDEEERGDDGADVEAGAAPDWFLWWRLDVAVRHVALDAGRELRCRGRRAVGLRFDGLPQDLGDVLHADDFVLALALHAVVEHDVAERARHRDAARAGGDRLLAPLGVDLLADALFHPHARAAGTAAHAARAVARHLDEV